MSAVERYIIYILHRRIGQKILQTLRGYVTYAQHPVIDSQLRQDVFELIVRNTNRARMRS